MNQQDQREAVLEVTTSRDIRNAVADALPLLHLTPTHHVRLELPGLSSEAVKNAAHAQAIAQQVGRVCQQLTDQSRVKHIHLFMAGPVELAVLIGQQLNALCPITLYEYSAQSYQPVATLL